MPKLTKAVNALFPTLVLEYDLRDFYDKQHLRSIIHDNTKNKDVCLDGTHGLFPDTWSSYTYNRNVLKPFPTLRKEIMNCINNYCYIAGFKEQALKESWYNISKAGASVDKHKHSSCNISATFYPVFNDGSSNLIVWRELPHNMKPANQFSSTVKEQTDYTIEKFELNIKEGHLYVWPAWLRHSAEPNQSNERLMIGINTVNKS